MPCADSFNSVISVISTMFFLCMLMDVIAMFAVEKQPSIAQLVER